MGFRFGRSRISEDESQQVEVNSSAGQGFWHGDHGAMAGIEALECPNLSTFSGSPSFKLRLAPKHLKVPFKSSRGFHHLLNFRASLNSALTNKFIPFGNLCHFFLPHQPRRHKMDNSPFNKLSAEIRNQIYELALTPDASISSDTSLSIDKGTAVQPALTRVCKQIRSETLFLL